MRDRWFPPSIYLIMALAAAGCGDAKPSGADAADAALADAALADAPGADAARTIEPPGVEIQFPPPRSRTELDAITVRGTAEDDDGIAAIRINGIAAASDDGFATWQATVPLQGGYNLLTVEKQDGAGNIVTAAAQAEVVNAPLLAQLDGIVLDPVRNRVLLADARLHALISVDLDTGLPTRLPGGELPRPVYDTPIVALALDPDQRRLWIVSSKEYEPFVLLSLDLVTGERTVVADANTGSGFHPIEVSAITVDAAGNRVLLLDAASNDLVAVDLASRERTVLVTIDTDTDVDYEAPLDYSNGMAVDAARNRLLITQPNYTALMAVDLTTGERTLILYFYFIQSFTFHGLDLELGRNRVLVSASNGYYLSLVAVDLTTGEHTVLAELGDGAQRWSGSGALVSDPDHDRVLILDDGGRVVAVDQTGGITSWLEPEIIGAGASMFGIQSLVLDDMRGRALALTSGDQAVLEIGLWHRQTAGLRSLIARDPLDRPRAIIMDVPRNRAIIYAHRNFVPVLVAMDLDSGVRSLLAGGGFDLGLVPDWSGKIAMDTRHHSIVGFEGSSLVSLDLTTGMHTAISDLATGTGPALILPRGLVVDSMRQRAIAINDNVSLISIDMATGDRRTLSALGIGPGGERQVLNDIALDLARERVLVTQAPTNEQPTRMWAVSLADGTPTELIGPTAGAGPPILDSLKTIAVDSRRNLAVVMTENPVEVFMVDLVTLQRVIVSQ